MANWTDENSFLEQYQTAVESARAADAIEPRAMTAHYDVANKLVVIRLKSGAVFSFPPSIAQGLADALEEDLAAVEVTPSGAGLHWEKLDVDFSVPGLLKGCFGTKAWMSELRDQWQNQRVS